MRLKIFVLFLFIPLTLFSCNPFFIPKNSSPNFGKTADHRVIHELWEGRIPEEDILQAKAKLHIGYGHTSHGSQISSGMSGLVDFANAGSFGYPYSQNLFSFSQDGDGGSLHLFEGDGYGDGPLDHDAGYYPNWDEETREFLEDSANSGYNVIMWSWCGQLSGKSEQSVIDTYLAPMAQLETDYSNVVFIYMTGHLDGSGETGNLHLRNEQIRQFCEDNDKWLFDFADIESYDPDGYYYLDKAGDDGCNYDSDGDGSRDANWAVEWQNSHGEDLDWYSCGSSHSQPLNANMKAYAAWWLFTEIAKVL